MVADVLKNVKIQFSGGCELLFNYQKTLILENVVPHGSSIADLVQLLKNQYTSQRPELFVDPQGIGPRPGILVLVNECDAEVLGGIEYKLNEGDVVEFISTLHGG